LVLANLRSTPVSYTVPVALANSHWKDALSGTSVTVGTQVALGAYEYKILSN
jgi:hypothetical protein